ncbi:protein of unknown function [Caballeronia sp. S22]
MRLAFDRVVEHGCLLLKHFGHDAGLVGRREREIGIRFAVGVFDLHARLFRDMHHGRVPRQAVHIEHRYLRVAAAHGGALEQLRADATAARAFEHRDAEFGRSLVALGGQIRQMADADQFQGAAEHAEHLVVREVDVAHIVLDDVIRHDLPEAQETVVFVESQKVREETLAICRGQFADENRHTRVFERLIVRDDRLGSAVDGQFHIRFSFVRHAARCKAKRILADYGETDTGKPLKRPRRHVLNSY